MGFKTLSWVWHLIQIITITKYHQAFSLWPAYVVVQCESIGPAQVSVDQDFSFRAVQVRTFDLCNVTPISPEQEPVDMGQNH